MNILSALPDQTREELGTLLREMLQEEGVAISGVYLLIQTRYDYPARDARVRSDYAAMLGAEIASGAAVRVLAHQYRLSERRVYQILGAEQEN